jgi:hypothetical protein
VRAFEDEGHLHGFLARDGLLKLLPAPFAALAEDYSQVDIIDGGEKLLQSLGGDDAVALDAAGLPLGQGEGNVFERGLGSSLTWSNR